MNIRIKIFLFCALSVLFIGCDQVTKHFVKHNLVEGVSTSYWHDTVRLIYVQNTGAMLNLGDDLSPYSMRNANKISSVELLCFCMIFAGGIGNIIDRILFDRHVTDFMNIGLGNLRTGIFNFADLCVTTGVIALLVFRYNHHRQRESVS